MTDPALRENANPETRSSTLTRAFRGLRAIKWQHALGELVLIVVGVVLALAVDNWNANRHDRRLERTVLQWLGSALSDDLVALRNIREDILSKAERIEALRVHLDHHLAYTDSLNADFGAVMRFWSLPVNRSPYEALKARGFDLVSSDSLRLRIIALYDHDYVELEHAQADDRASVLDAIRPYYLQKFRDVRFGEYARPLDYGAVAVDPYYRNLLDYRLASLRANPLAASEVAISQLQNLIALVGASIARLRS